MKHNNNISNMYSIDLEVKPNLFVMGYRKANDLHSNNFIIYNDIAYTYESETKTLNEVTEDQLLNIYNVLNSKLVAHNGYNYDFPLIEVIRNYIYYIIHRRIKQSNDTRSFEIDSKLLNNNINATIYNISKCIISIKPYFLSDHFKTNKAKSKKKSGGFGLSERELTLNQRVILNTFYFKPIGLKSSANIGFKLWRVEQTFKSNPNYFDSLCCFDAGKEPCSIEDIESVYMRRQNKSGFVTDWDAPCESLEELDEIIRYNYNDLDVLTYLTNHNKFKDHFNVVKLLEKMVTKMLKNNYSDSGFANNEMLVFNGLTAPEITGQWNMSALTLLSCFKNEYPLYAPEINKLHYGGTLRKTIKLNPSIYHKLHAPISRSSIDEKFNLPVIRDFKPLNNILDFMKKTVIGNVHDAMDAHAFNAAFRTSAMNEENVNRYVSLNKAYSDYISVKLSLGGLHTQRLKPYPDLTDHLSLSEYKYVEFDVSSFYPWLIIKLGLISELLQSVGLLEEYAKLMERRLACKRFKPGKELEPILKEIEEELEGKLEPETIKTFTSALKLILNSLSGLLQSFASICFDPLLANQLRLIGQSYLIILMQRITEFNFDEFRLIYANTDGIMVAIKRDKVDHYIAKFNTEASKLSQKVFDQDVPFEIEQYDAIKYADISNIVKIETLDLTSCNNVLDIGAALKGAKFKFVSNFNTSAKASYESRIIALNHCLFGRDIKSQLEEVKALKSPNWHRSVYSSTLTAAYRAFALADPNKDNAIELDGLHSIRFYPSKSSKQHLFIVNANTGKLTKFADFNVRVMAKSECVEDIIKSDDFDWDVYTQLIEEDVDKMNKESDPEELDNFEEVSYDLNNDPIDVHESLFDIYKRKLELESYGLMTQPAQSRSKTHQRGDNRAGKSEYEFKNYCKQMWLKHGEKVGKGGTKAINVFLPSNYVLFDADKPDLLKSDFLVDLKQNSDCVIGREGSNRFKCIYKLPSKYIDHNLYLRPEHYNVGANVNVNSSDIKSALEIFQGGNCQNCNRSVTLYGAHTLNEKSGEVTIKYVDAKKPENWADGAKILPEEMVDKYFTTVKVKYTINSAISRSQQSSDMMKFFFERSLRTDINNPYIKWFENVLTDHQPLSNNDKINTVWTLMRFGYDTGTLDLIIHALRHFWHTYDKLENQMSRFDPTQKKSTGIVSLEKYYKNDKETLNEIYRDIFAYLSDPKEIYVQKDFGSDIVNAVFVYTYKEMFPHTRLFESKEALINSGTIERYRERYNLSNYFVNSSDYFNNVRLYNILKGLGVQEFIDNNKEIQLCRYTLQPNMEKPEIRYDDPVLLRDVVSKQAQYLDVRQEFNKIFTSNTKENKITVNLLNAPTGCGKTCSGMKRLAELMKVGQLIDGCAIVLTSTHLEANTIASYLYNDLMGYTDDDDFLMLNGSTDISRLVHKAFGKKEFKELSNLEKNEFFEKFKVICLNSTTTPYMKDLMKWFTKNSSSVTNKIFLLMAHYLQPHRMNGQAYGIAEALVEAQLNVKYTFIDEIHNVLGSMQYEMIASDILLKKHCQEVVAAENRLTTLFKWVDKSDNNDQFLLDSGVQESLTPGYAKCYEYELDRDIPKHLSDNWELYSEPIHTPMYDLSYYLNPNYHDNVQNYEFVDLKEAKKDYFSNNDNADNINDDNDDTSDTSDGNLESKNSKKKKFQEYQVCTFIRALIDTAPIVNVRYVYPITRDGEGFSRVESLNEFRNMNKANVLNWKNNINMHKFDDDPTVTPYAPILKIYNTRLITKLITKSRQVVCATATWLTPTKKIMDAILPNNGSVDVKYWCSVRKEEDKLEAATIVIPPWSFIDCFDTAIYRTIIRSTLNKMLFFLPSIQDVQAHNRKLNTGDVKAAVLNATTIDVTPDMTSNLNNLYRLEENRGSGPLQTAIASALGASGTGLNLPEYSIVYTSVNAHKSITLFTLIESKEELTRVIFESLGATAIQNVGRVMRIDLNKPHDDQNRAIIVDGISKVSEELRMILDPTINKLSLSIYLREAVLYYVDQNVKTPTVGTLMLTQEDEAQMTMLKEEARKHCFEHCLKSLLHFVDTGEEPIFEDFRDIVLNPKYQEQVKQRETNTREKVLTSFDMVKKYNFDFKVLAKELGIKRTDLNYTNYNAMVLNHRCKHLSDQIQSELSIFDPATGDISIMKFAKYLESLDIRGADKKHFMSIENLEVTYYARLAELIKAYLDTNPDVNKREFYRKHTLDSKFGQYKNLLLHT